MKSNRSLKLFFLFVGIASLTIFTVSPASGIEVSGGGFHSLGLNSDGTVVATGDNTDNQCDVSEWEDIVQVAAGGHHSLGLKSDGTVVATGDNTYNQCDVSEWSGIEQVAAGEYFSLGLKSDGTVEAAGRNNYLQCDVGEWSDIVQVAAGYWHSLGLESDGTVVAAGRNNYGQCNVGGWSGIEQVAAGWVHSLGLETGGTVAATGNDDFDQCDVSGWSLSAASLISLCAGLGNYPTSGGYIETFASDYSHEGWIRVNWSAYNAANGETRVATGDIDGDGKDEIVVGLGPVDGNESIPAGWFQVFDDDYTHLAWGKIRYAAYNSANGETWPACGDVDGDGKDEIVVGLGSYTTDGGWFEVFDFESGAVTHKAWQHVRWSDYNSTNGETRPACGDIDGDGSDEIVIGLGPVDGDSTNPGGWFEIFDDDLSPLAWGKVRYSAYNNANGETWPACGDVDGDGSDEIVVGLGAYPADGGWLEVFDYGAGSLTHKAWQHVRWSDYNSTNGETRPACGDVDGDAKDEVVIGLGSSGQGYMEVFDDDDAGYAHMAWPRIRWSAYNTANGETRAAIQLK